MVDDGLSIFTQRVRKIRTEWETFFHCFISVFSDRKPRAVQIRRLATNPSEWELISEKKSKILFFYFFFFSELKKKPV